MKRNKKHLRLNTIAAGIYTKYSVIKPNENNKGKKATTEKDIVKDTQLPLIMYFDEFHFATYE